MWMGLALGAERPEVYRAIGEMTAKEGYLRPGGEKQIGQENS